MSKNLIFKKPNLGKLHKYAQTEEAKRKKKEMEESIEELIKDSKQLSLETLWIEFVI